MEYCFGVDIGGTTVKIGVFTAAGEAIDKWEIPTRTEFNGVNILPDIAESVKKKAEELQIKKEEIVGIGVGVPAPVDSEGVVQNTANLGWGYKEVKRELEELTGIRAEIGNDANVAALGEMWMGAGAGEPNMIMVTLGTGVGGGIVVEGQCIVGAHGSGGEIGHLHVNSEETERCGCGNLGCLEQYASATGIRRLALKHLEKSTRASVLRDISPESLDAKAVFDALKAGDQLAQETVEEFANYLGTALANLAVVTDPAVIVIGGGVSKAGEILIDHVKVAFDKHAFFGNKGTRIVLASLGNDAGMCGAAKLIL